MIDFRKDAEAMESAFTEICLRSGKEPEPPFYFSNAEFPDFRFHTEDEIEIAWRKELFFNNARVAFYKCTTEEDLHRIDIIATGLLKKYGYIDDWSDDILKLLVEVKKHFDSKEDKGDLITLADYALIMAERRKTLIQRGLLDPAENLLPNHPNRIAPKPHQSANSNKIRGVSILGTIVSKGAIDNAVGTLIAAVIAAIFGALWAIFSRATFIGFFEKIGSFIKSIFL